MLKRIKEYITDWLMVFQALYLIIGLKPKDHKGPIYTQYDLQKIREAGSKFIPKPNHRVDKCKHGHEYTPENTTLDKRTGFRKCRKCRRIRWATKHV